MEEKLSRALKDRGPGVKQKRVGLGKDHTGKNGLPTTLYIVRQELPVCLHNALALLRHVPELNASCGKAIAETDIETMSGAHAS